MTTTHTVLPLSRSARTVATISWHWTKGGLYPKSLGPAMQKRLVTILDTVASALGQDQIRFQLTAVEPKHSHAACIFVTNSNGHGAKSRQSDLRMEFNFGDKASRVPGYGPRVVITACNVEMSTRVRLDARYKYTATLQHLSDDLTKTCDLSVPTDKPAEVSLVLAAAGPSIDIATTSSGSADSEPSPLLPLTATMGAEELQMATIRAISVGHGIWNGKPIVLDELIEILQYRGKMHSAREVVRAMVTWKWLLPNGVGYYLSDEAMRFCYEEGDPPNT